MNYFLDVYMKIYWLICSFESWVFFGIVTTFGATAIIALQSENHRYKGQITYFIITSLVCVSIFKILFYVFAPSPEFLGLVR